MNDREKPPTTLSFHWCHMETTQNTLATANDPERPPTTGSKFGAKSSSLNEDFERPLTTMKDCQRRQRLAVIPNDPDTPMTAKDRQRHPATGNDYMESRPLTLLALGFFGWCSTGGAFHLPLHNSFVFNVRLLKFCTGLLWDKINILQ